MVGVRGRLPRVALSDFLGSIVLPNPLPGLAEGPSAEVEVSIIAQSDCLGYSFVYRPRSKLSGYESQDCQGVPNGCCLIGRDSI